MSADSNPDEAFAVSPMDHSSDREQSDADNAAAVTSQSTASRERAEARDQAAVNHQLLLDAINRQADSNLQLATATVEYQERARLATEREKRAEARHKASMRRMSKWFGAIFAVLLVGISTVVVITFLDNRTGKDTRDQIASCVTPQGKCHKQGLKDQAEAIGKLIQVQVDAAVCAARYADLPLLEAKAATGRCMAVLAAVERPAPKPTPQPSAPISGPRAAPGGPVATQGAVPATATATATVTQPAAPGPTSTVRTTVRPAPSNPLCFPLVVPTIPLLPVPSLGLC